MKVQIQKKRALWEERNQGGFSEDDRVLREIKAKVEEMLLIQAREREEYNRKLQEYIEMISMQRPLEPLLKNILRYFCSIPSDCKQIAQIRNHIKTKQDQFYEHWKMAHQQIIALGVKMIAPEMIVATHSYSMIVVDILTAAQKQNIRFEVCLTEGRPYNEGKNAAQELASKQIPVTYYIDSAMRQAIKRADIVLLGATAMTQSGQIIATVGSELAAMIAHQYQVPVYIAMHSWKLDSSLSFGFDATKEKKFRETVWNNPPKGVTIASFGSEIIDPTLISAVISEVGVYPPNRFVIKAFEEYPWMRTRQHN